MRFQKAIFSVPVPAPGALSQSRLAWVQSLEGPRYELEVSDERPRVLSAVCQESKRTYLYPLASVLALEPLSISRAVLGKLKPAGAKP